MYQVCGLGNALVDTEVEIEDSFLRTHGIAKGHMTLIDGEQMQALTAALAELPKKRCSGGSAANTIFTINAFGVPAHYNCKVADDETGKFFIDDITAAGVGVNDNALSPMGASGQCLVMITPDAQRTMTTDLGISFQLGTQEVHQEVLRNASHFYVEGYMRRIAYRHRSGRVMPGDL